MKLQVLVLSLTLGLPLLAAPSNTSTSAAPEKAAPLVSTSEDTIKDIRRTLGMVPSFLASYPEHAIEGIWQEFKGLQLSETKLSMKEKELIGLGVAAQIPCKYCVVFHTEAAKLHGASTLEINEALASASTTRKWSTYLFGNRMDQDDFRSDIGKMVRNMKKNTERAPEDRPKPMVITDAESVYKDVDNHFGFVPAFIKEYPVALLPGAWKHFSAIEASNMALAPKVKELVSLGVSAQIPCQYCIHAHTEFAKMHGASKAEVQEAVLMSAMVRHWSTFLNGIQMDESKFRSELRQIISHVRKQSTLSE